MMKENFRMNSDDFIGILKEQFSFGNKVKLTVTGNSMIPFLADKRDYVFLEQFSGKAEKGDILFYQRENSACVLHRVIRNENNMLWFIGDSQIAVEGPINISNVLAECNEVIRKGKPVKKNDPLWNFFSTVWLRIIRLRHPVMKIIGKVK